MDGRGWTRWFTSADGLRSPWRVLLFVVFFTVVIWLEGLLLPFVTGLEVPDGRLSFALVAQTGLILVAALAAAWIMLRWVDRRPRESLGFPLQRRAVLEMGVGLAVGAAALAAVVAVFAVFGGYRYTGDTGSFVDWLAMVVLALVALAIPAASEEAFLRGYPLKAIVEGPGAVVGVLFTSLVFAMLHGGNPNVSSFGLINIFLAGVLLAVAVLRTGTLWFATGVHLGWNWIMSGPLDLPVSGLQGLDAPLYDVVVVGPAWLTGGSFGPEGGLAGTLGACLGLILVIWVTRPGAVLAGAER